MGRDKGGLGKMTAEALVKNMDVDEGCEYKYNFKGVMKLEPVGLRKFEYYDTGEDSSFITYTVVKHGQTFTVGNVGINVDFFPIKARVKFDGNGIAGDDRVLKCYLYNTTDGLPSGEYIAYTAMNVSPTYLGWLDISLAPNRILRSGKMYALIVSFDSALTTRWCCDISSPTYTGGTSIYSGLGNWYIDNTVDFMFEIWGRVFAPRNVSIVDCKVFGAPKKISIVGSGRISCL